MANLKISDLPLLEMLPDGAYVPVVSNGKLYKAEAVTVATGEGVFYNRVDGDGLPIEITIKTSSGFIGGNQFCDYGYDLFTYRNLEIVHAKNIHTLAEESFYNMISLRNADIPGVKEVGAFSFQYCKALERIDLSEAVNIGNNAFYDCSLLQDIDLSKAQIIDTGAFYRCFLIDPVELPEVKTIRSKAFYGCLGMGTLNIPKVVTLLSQAFMGCENLKSVTLGSPGNPLLAVASNAFNNCTQSDLTITVYTEGGAAVSGEPWGATNATIIYKEA